MKRDSGQFKIVFFDGVCVLCNGSVDFLMKKDRKRLLKFASLQSEFARTALGEESGPGTGQESVVFLDNDKIFKESTAILRIFMNLPFPWKLLSGLLLVPSFVRNPVYRILAKNRYRWFGKRESCRMPDEVTGGRILQ